MILSGLDKNDIIDRTRQWISSVVIGLDLCPFAQRVFQGDLIRYHVSDATDPEELRTDLAKELEILAASSATAIETTFLIHPGVLQEFADYCDFLSEAESTIRLRSYRGVFQIASFHPQYRFADAAPDAVENYTNRSPFPMLHLLREQSISAAADMNAEALLRIPQQNVARLRSLGLQKILALNRSAGEKRNSG